MRRAMTGLGKSCGWLAAAGGFLVLSAGCGDVPSDTDTTAGGIIGGSAPLSVTSRRSLGLVESSNCSGGLMNPDFVVTASHCISWSNVPGMTFKIPRSDSGYDQRAGAYAVQVGSSDITLVKLAPAAPGNMWPQVSHPVTTSTAASYVNGNVTCYGEGYSAYDTDGAGVHGFGTYMSLTKQILSLNTDAFSGDYYLVTSPDGQHVLSWGDSGSSCYDGSGQLVAVHSGGNCSNWQGMGQPNDPGCGPSNVITQRDNWMRATAGWRGYMTAALTRAGATFEPIPMINGWQPGAYGANGPGATNVNGVVTLRGAISGGAAQNPFTLPAAYRPSARVYVPVVTTNDSIGRLIIDTNGDVNIECEGGPGFCMNSSYFTSLDGVSFVQDPATATGLTLINGWSNAPYGQRAPAVKTVNGQVHFLGGMVTSGTSARAFQLPSGFRPLVDEWLPISLCWSAKGRMHVGTDGNVDIYAENNAWGSAQCFASLEGASFAVSESAGTSVALTNGWVSKAYGSGFVRFVNDNGVVRLKGAASGGTAAKIFTLPSAFHPATNVWLYVDTVGGKRGRILITPDGSVSVDPTTELADAESFISFEGAAFGL